MSLLWLLSMDRSPSLVRTDRARRLWNYFRRYSPGVTAAAFGRELQKREITVQVAFDELLNARQLPLRQHCSKESYKNAIA